MHAFQLHAALCNHIARNRRIDTARKQHRRASARSGGQSARALHSRSVNVRREIADFHIDDIRRIVHVHRDLRECLGNSAADFL